MATSFWGHSPDTLNPEQEARRIRRNIAEMIPVTYVSRTVDEFREQHQWLWDNIAANDYQIYGTDPKNHKRRLIYFRHERDAVYFTLRWS